LRPSAVAIPVGAMITGLTRFPGGRGASPSPSWGRLTKDHRPGHKRRNEFSSPIRRIAINITQAPGQRKRPQTLIPNIFLEPNPTSKPPVGSMAAAIPTIWACPVQQGDLYTGRYDFSKGQTAPDFKGSASFRAGTQGSGTILQKQGNTFGPVGLQRGRKNITDPGVAPT